MKTSYRVFLLLMIGVILNAAPADAQPYAYVTKAATVSVIETATNTVIDTIAVGIEPKGIAITLDGAYAYVANWGSDNVSVIDMATNAVVDTVEEIRYANQVAITPASPPPTTVTIDIKPSKKTDENAIDLKKDKNLKVAIVGSIAFDALRVDPATVKFGTFNPDAASPTRFKGQDYNHDGFSDLILTFKLSETGIEDCTDDPATLTGETYGGTAILGADDFNIEECEIISGLLGL